MKIIILWLFSCASLSVFAAGAPHDQLEVHDPWVREAPPSVKILVAYLTLHNHSDKTHMVSSITSPQFERVEIHRTEIKDGMTRMLPVSKIMVSPDGKVLFEPGGLHLMLINPVKNPRSGDTIQFILHLLDGSSLNFIAPVKKGHGLEDHSQHKMNHDSHNEDKRPKHEDNTLTNSDHHH